MTEQEYILARLQVEREQRMSGWNVPGAQRDRVQPRQPRRDLAEQEAGWLSQVAAGSVAA